MVTDGSARALVTSEPESEKVIWAPPPGQAAERSTVTPPPQSASGDDTRLRRAAALVCALYSRSSTAALPSRAQQGGAAQPRICHARGCIRAERAYESARVSARNKAPHERPGGSLEAAVTSELQLRQRRPHYAIKSEIGGLSTSRLAAFPADRKDWET